MNTIPEYRVWALKLGNLTIDKSIMTYQSGIGTEVTVPVWGAAVEGNGHKMLVDTGIGDPDRWTAELGAPTWHDEKETLPEALAEIGWSLKDVDIVINSHLHYDHAENNTLLPHARFYVSLTEWDFARNPISTQKALYDYAYTDESLTYMNYQFVGQDYYEVMPGIRLIQTPGHSRGHQSALINTEGGVLCVAGDAACFTENFTGPTPPGNLSSTEQALDSIEKMRRHSDLMFMNHDPELTKFQEGNWPLTPKL